MGRRCVLSECPLIRVGVLRTVAACIFGPQVLDVKPYLRHDIRPDASVPSWCEPVTASSLIREVDFAPTASAALSGCVARLRLYEDEATVREAIVQTLLLDIRSVHQGRGEVAAGQHYHVRIDQLDITFETYESRVLVTACRLRDTWRVDA